MNFLEKMVSNAEVEISSLEIAELTGKRHDHVMRDIRNEMEELGELGLNLFRESFYTHPNGGELPCFIMDKAGAKQIVLGYDTITRFKVIEYVKELEKKNKPIITEEYISGLKDLVKQEELKNNTTMEEI